MVDQGAVSAGNFATAILLARALVPAEYGIYALLFAVMLFMLNIHLAAVVYGLSLHGAPGTVSELRSLAGGSLVLTALLGTVLGAAAGAVAAIFRRAYLGPWILLALLFWLFQQTTRSALATHFRQREAVWGDALSYLGQAACMGWLFLDHRLTLVAAFQVMAATSAAAWLLQIGQLRLAPSDFQGALALVPRFWKFGRWAVLAKVAEAFIGQPLLWLLALQGMAAVASFQSVLNLLRLTNPLMFAIGSVVLPTVASAPLEKPTAGMRAVRRYGLLGAAALLPYYAVLFLIPAKVLRLFYGVGSAYVGLGMDLRIVILGSALLYAGHIFASYFYGLSKSNVVFHCQLITAAVTVTAGLTLVLLMGLMGAALAYDLAFLAQMAAFAWFLRKVHVSPAKSAPLVLE